MMFYDEMMIRDIYKKGWLAVLATRKIMIIIRMIMIIVNMMMMILTAFPSSLPPEVKVCQKGKVPPNSR